MASTKIKRNHAEDVTLNTQELFQLYPTTFDIREHLSTVLLLFLVSPGCASVLSWYTCMKLFVASIAIPRIVRLRYPRFMETNVLDDLRFQAGATMSMLASTTAINLQNHNTSISIALGQHSDFKGRPLARIMRTYLFAEMALNGSSEEKEQMASWLRWTHRHVHGAISEETREEFGIPKDVTTYGYIDELKAYVIETLTWSTLSFQTRFGKQLSKRAKDTVVLEYTCAGLRLGIPEHLLARDYDSFLVSFNRRLDVNGNGNALTRSVVEELESSLLTAKTSWIIGILARCSLLIGFDLLPERVKVRYQLKFLSTWYARALQRIMMSLLWVVYPTLAWLPLRGLICFLLVVEPQLRPIFMSSLKAIHSMDILNDKPTYKTKDLPNLGSPSYLPWLEAGKDGRSFLQAVLVRVLATQLALGQAPASSIARITPWIILSGRIFKLSAETLAKTIYATVAGWNIQIKESQIFRGDQQMPRHIGLIMDGNRRYARNLGQPVLVGHQKGAQTAGNILEWWLRFMPNTAAYTTPGPRYITVWALSAENFKRGEAELEDLFRLMTAEFKSLALTSLVHVFRIRVRIIGCRDGLPRELLDMMELLEDSTSTYTGLFFQIAVGYGGRDEILRSVKDVLTRGEDVNEETVSAHTFCGKIHVPPVELLVRTSERRTSGMFLWDTQFSELHFIDKLWPELTESDWLDVIASFSKREMRRGT